MRSKTAIGFLGYIMRILNVFAVIALFLAYVSQFISPQTFWIPAFFGLAYPVIFLVNLFFIAYWIFNLRLFALVSLITVFIGFGLPKFYVKFSAKNTIENPENAFKVMSFNVHDFDYYSQTYGNNNEGYDTIIGFIKSEKPDIICFQEFYSHDLNPDKSNWAKLRLQCGYLFGYREKYNDRTKRAYLSIVSKYQIIDKGIIENADGNKDITGIFADIIVSGRIVRVYNVHLNSMGISSETDYITRSYELSESDMQIASAGARKMTSRMKRGYIKRALQAEQIQNHIENSPYPVILAGDFNDTPCSYTFRTVSKDLFDSFALAGKGFSNTFNNGIYPSYRIDYILYDKFLIAYDYKRIKLKASDHFPISSNFVFNPEETHE